MKNNTQEIYIHIPFCEKKCDYCDFVSFVCDEDVKKRYFSRLFEQIKNKAEFAGNMPVDSVFFGGGTPSSVKPEYIKETLKVIRDCFLVTQDAEITIEMNPNTVTDDKLDIYKASGINRLSMGLQSANNDELKRLGRIHNYEDFLRAYELVRSKGFRNVNVDIMSALPGQSRSSYRETLNRVIKLNPEHISAYSLIIEEGTPFYERYSDGEGLPDEDTEREMYYDTKDILSKSGYLRYEISNYSKEGFECRHNLGYWTGRQYIGAGLAAASLIGSTRFQMHRDLKKYLSGDFAEEKEDLSEDDIISEFMFLGLRLTKGIGLREFKEKFGLTFFDIYADAYNKLTNQGLLVFDRETERIFLSDKGLDVANYCMSEFIL